MWLLEHRVILGRRVVLRVDFLTPARRGNLACDWNAYASFVHRMQYLLGHHFSRTYILESAL